jgi:hypothetical protein
MGVILTSSGTGKISVEKRRKNAKSYAASTSDSKDRTKRCRSEQAKPHTTNVRVQHQPSPRRNAKHQRPRKEHQNVRSLPCMQRPSNPSQTHKKGLRMTMTSSEDWAKVTFPAASLYRPWPIARGGLRDVDSHCYRWCEPPRVIVYCPPRMSSDYDQRRSTLPHSSCDLILAWESHPLRYTQLRTVISAKATDARLPLSR